MIRRFRAVSGTILTVFNGFPVELLYGFALALLVSSAGFYRVVYFVSIGYAFSITAQAVAASFWFRESLDLLSGIQCLGLAIYGLRLGSYLISRERSPSYQQEVEAIQQRNKNMAVQKRIMIWISVALLYVLMFSPALFNMLHVRSYHQPSSMLLQIIGIVVMGLGLFIETTSDAQKSRFKQDKPKDYCRVGLYRWVRCPNYLGEIIFWLGNFIAGMAAYHGVFEWIGASIGIVCIVLIMLGSTKRLESKQLERYGEREDFQIYIKSVPVLFPFLPIYSLRGCLKRQEIWRIAEEMLYRSYEEAETLSE